MSTLRRKGDSSGRKEKNSCWKVVWKDVGKVLCPASLPYTECSTYDMYNNMEAKYLKYLEPYDICVCDNPRQSYDGTLSENTITDGLTHLSKGNGVCERLLFLRANKEGLSQAVYHELGHIIDFNDFNSDSFMSDSQTVVDSMEAEMPALKEKYHISDQNTSTRMEYFAEAFRLSFSDPDGLRETAPHIASYMENMKAQI